MKNTVRIVVLAGLWLAAAAAGAQNCADLEQRLGAQPLAMLGLLDAARCLGSAADAEPVTATLRWTENGPVIPGSHYGLAAVTTQPTSVARAASGSNGKPRAV